MTALFGATLFLSAFLLFSVQPMFARMILPLLGGAPAVWNTCMVFFQASLLAGYLYAHFAVERIGARRQPLVHLALVAAAVAVLPIGLPSGWEPPATSHPVGWILLLLAAALGPPVLALSATAPLLQAWYARTGHREAGDPYFLYGASNLGSLAALALYPFLVEPLFTLGQQCAAWSGGYLLLAALLAGCAAAVRRSPGMPAAAASASGATGAPPLVSRLRWLALAFVPSSLLLGVTSYLTTDFAAIPLLWIVPLSLYLLSFVLVFARRPPLPHRWMVAAQPWVIVPLAVVNPILIEGFLFRLPITVLVPLHLANFFLASLVCHGELAASRPPARHLTSFYLWLSAGGVLGGVFTALVAPLVFRTVAEYPLALVLACLLRPTPAAGRRPAQARLLDLLLPLALAGVVALLERLTRGGFGGWSPEVWKACVYLGAGAVVALGFASRPVRLALGLAVILLAGARTIGAAAIIVHRERTFFGVVRVMETADRRSRSLSHGTTIHGVQSLLPAYRREPLTYYTRRGPLGDVFRTLDLRAPARDVGVVGLGIGSAAAYARPRDRVTYYEIDPAVARIAADTRLFTFLADAPPSRVVVGDARLRLAAGGARHDLLVVDAFSSDHIPVHLLTAEAFALYRRTLADGGLLAVNLTNNYFSLEGVIARQAREAGLVGLIRYDETPDPDPVVNAAKASSAWAVLARRREDLEPLPRLRGWRPLRGEAGRPWTDDYANVLATLVLP